MFGKSLPTLKFRVSCLPLCPPAGAAGTPTGECCTPVHTFMLAFSNTFKWNRILILNLTLQPLPVCIVSSSEIFMFSSSCKHLWLTNTVEARCRPLLVVWYGQLQDFGTGSFPPTDFGFKPQTSIRKSDLVLQHHHKPFGILVLSVTLFTYRP